MSANMYVCTRIVSGALTDLVGLGSSARHEATALVHNRLYSGKVWSVSDGRYILEREIRKNCGLDEEEEWGVGRVDGGVPDLLS